MDIIMRINQQVSAFVWGPAMVALMLGTGIYLSIFTRFFQVTKFGRILHNTLGSPVSYTHLRVNGTLVYTELANHPLMKMRQRND